MLGFDLPFDTTSTSDPASQPGRNPLTLGSVTFATGEAPDSLTFGLLVHHHITDLIGGGRTIATFGTHPAPVSWEGRIWGPNVATRVAALKHMLTAQSEVPISFGIESYFCLVTKFEPKYLAIDCLYSITVEITRDNNGALSSAAPASLDTQVSGLTTNAQTYASQIQTYDPTGGAGLFAQTNNVIAATSSAGPLAQLFGSSLTGVLNTVGTALTAAKTYTALLGPLAPQFLAASQLTSTLGLVGRLIQAGQSTQTITAYGETLAELAAQHYGNADLGIALGAANAVIGSRTPPGVFTTLIAPPFPVTAPTT